MIGEIGSTDVQEKRELPDGWRWVKLGAVCKQDRQIVEPNTREAESLVYYSLEHIESETGRILKSPVDQVEDEGKSTTFRFDECHVLYGKLRPYLNKVALPLSEGRCTTELIPLLPGDNVDRIFLAWLLRRQETVDFAMGEKTGSRMPRADMKLLLTLSVPLPPLPEQQRIAALLKEHMAAVDKAREAAEERLAAIKALPAAFLRQVFPESDQPLPNGWRWVKLGDVCKVVGGAQPPKSFFRYDAHPDYIRLVQIQDFRLSDVAVYIPKYMAVKTFDESDVMIGRYGPPVFQILRGLSGAYNVALMKTETSSALNKDYLYFILQWPNIQNAVIAQSQRAAGQSGVQKEFLENYTIPLPVLSEQQRIASQLKEQFTAVDTARKSAEAELETINALPAALLRRAFNGEL
jgi:type I restriction enzyme S subunit